MERFRYGKSLIVIILAPGMTGLPDDAAFPGRPESDDATFTWLTWVSEANVASSFPGCG